MAESVLIVVGLGMILIPMGWVDSSPGQLGGILAGLVLLSLGARRLSRYVFSQRRRYFELRRAVVAFLDDVRRLNRLAVEERHGDAERLRDRLHDQVDSMVLAAGWDGDLRLEELGAAPSSSGEGGSGEAVAGGRSDRGPSPSRARRLIDRILVGAGAVVVLATALTMTHSPWVVGAVGIGALLVQAGVWRLADPILPDDREYLPLRRHVEAFLADVRTLNHHAVEGETDALESLRSRLHEKVDGFFQVAGKRVSPESPGPRQGEPQGT